MKFPLTQELKIEMVKNLDPDADIPALDPSSHAHTAPFCIYCPNPSFSEAVLNSQHQGTVALKVVVGSDGKARDILVIQHSGAGFTLQAVQAVQKWSFKPGRGPDGKTIELRMIVEVSFRS